MLRQNSVLEAGYGYSDKEQINRATIGGGTITLANQEALPTTLNRDITASQEITKDKSENYDIYASQSSIDQTLNPTQTVEKWGQLTKDNATYQNGGNGIMNDQKNRGQVIPITML